MNPKNAPWHLGVILASIALTVWFLVPSIRYYMVTNQDALQEFIKKEPTILKRIFTLGLDLQGGVRLVLEVDRTNIDARKDKDLLDRAYTVIENRINALGVAEPSIQKQGQDRLIIELPGLKDEQRAKEIIGKTAQLEFMLLREPAQLEHAVKIIDDVMKGKLSADTTDTLKKDTTKVKQEEAQNLANRLFTGSEKSKEAAAKAAAESTKTAQQADTTFKGIASFKELLVRAGDMIGATPENRLKIDRILRRPDVHDALERSGLGGNAFLWNHDTSMLGNAPHYTLYYVKSAPEMRGDGIKDARAAIDQSGMHGGAAQVELEMTPKGTRTFTKVTGANVNKFLAIVLDSSVYSAPRIIQKIAGGRAEITGNFSMEEARNLAIVLRAGALPAPVKIIQESTVGPSMGQDSIKMGIQAAIIGFALVFFFILIYYRASGAYANVALILNMFMTLAIMAGINTTLTLPGICSLVLSLAMAVDANVLICERIREELAIGKTVRSAIETGYKRAFIVILDSNLTTLITAFILLWLGTGPIKGFAVTLILGLTISMYTALFVTHVMYNILTPKNAVKLSI